MAKRITFDRDIFRLLALVFILVGLLMVIPGGSESLKAHEKDQQTQIELKLIIEEYSDEEFADLQETAEITDK